MTRYAEIVKALCQHGVDFLIIGGVAANLNGSARATYDLDVAYARNKGNLQKLVACLQPYKPYLRGAPPGLPFRFDMETVERGLNFTLTTDLGDLDLLGEVTGGGKYEDLLPHSQKMDSFGVQFLVLGVERLIQLKRAAGRPKDLEVIAELEKILELKRKTSP